MLTPTPHALLPQCPFPPCAARLGIGSTRTITPLPHPPRHDAHPHPSRPATPRLPLLSRGVASWDWFYPFHYAPMASELYNLGDVKGELFN